MIAQPPVFIEVIGMVPFDSFCQISESCRTVPADSVAAGRPAADGPGCDRGVRGQGVHGDQAQAEVYFGGAFEVEISGTRGRFETTEKVKRKAREQTKRREDMV